MRQNLETKQEGVTHCKYSQTAFSYYITSRPTGDTTLCLKGNRLPRVKSENVSLNTPVNGRGKTQLSDHKAPRRFSLNAPALFSPRLTANLLPLWPEN